MTVERNIGSTLVDTKPVIKPVSPVEVKSLERVAALTKLADAKEFSLDTVEAVVSEEPYSIACAKCAKCVGPCVQQCLPRPPAPKCR